MTAHFSMTAPFGEAVPTETRRRFILFAAKPTSSNIEQKYSVVRQDYYSKFMELVKKWNQETAFYSSTREKLASSHFKEIVLMGAAAIPLITSELKREPSFLFLALQQITNENPVPIGSRGSVQKICDAWLRWAERAA